jgi:prephenate dehydratase
VHLFFYAPAGGTKGANLLSEIVPLVPPEKLEVFQSSRDLAARLLKQKNDFSVAVLVNPKKEELKTLIPFRNSIRETRFLLILSDEERETISLAHRLFPSFISYMDDKNAEVVSVLQRLIEILPNGSSSQGADSQL